MHKRTKFAILATLLLPTISYGQHVSNPSAERLAFQATRSEETINIDGDLDELIWQQTSAIVDFVQKEPHQLAATTYSTEVHVAYDEKALYIAAICFQPRDQTRVQNLQRDFSFDENDLFGVAIDGFIDQRNAVAFQTTPFGNQRDLEVIDGSEVNLNWDARWSVRTRIHEDRWVAEIAIPWRNLRYPLGANRLGVIFARNVRSLNEESSIPAVPRVFSIHRMAYAGELSGFEAPPPKTNVQLNPYGLSQQLSESETSGNIDTEVGGELKWAITPSTVLDLTVNTDFAQADADHQAINLDRFSVFFPERRQFFLENANIFTASVTEWISPFFSRRIGLDDFGGRIPLDGGLRLTSRSPQQQIGLLAMRQQSLDTSPASNFAVTRYSRNISGQSRLGGMLTYRHDDAVSTGVSELGANTNATYTVDGLWQPSQSFGIQGMASASNDDTTGDGLGSQLWVFFRTNHLSLSSLNYYSKDYHPGIGLELLDANYMMNSLIANLDIRSTKLPASIRSLNPGASVFAFRNVDDNNLLFAYAPIRPVQVRFESGAQFSVIIEPNRQRLAEAFSPAGIDIAPGEYNYTRYRLAAKTDQSRKFATDASIETGNYFDGSLTSYAVSGRIAPSPRVELTADLQVNQINNLGVAVKDETTRLYRLNTRVALSPRLHFSSFYQRDNLSDQSAWNFRLSWEYRPLSYLYIVFNKSDKKGLDPSERIDQNQLIVKASYLFEV